MFFDVISRNPASCQFSGRFGQKWALGPDSFQTILAHPSLPKSVESGNGCDQLFQASKHLMHVMKRAKRVPNAPELAYIPTSIWALLCEHMELRAWVRVAGTCKASWAVQYNEIMSFGHYSLDVSGRAPLGLREPSYLN